MRTAILATAVLGLSWLSDALPTLQKEPRLDVRAEEVAIPLQIVSPQWNSALHRRAQKKLLMQTDFSVAAGSALLFGPAPLEQGKTYAFEVNLGPATTAVITQIRTVVNGSNNYDVVDVNGKAGRLDTTRGKDEQVRFSVKLAASTGVAPATLWTGKVALYVKEDDPAVEIPIPLSGGDALGTANGSPSGGNPAPPAPINPAPPPPVTNPVSGPAPPSAARLPQPAAGGIPQGFSGDGSLPPLTQNGYLVCRAPPAGTPPQNPGSPRPEVCGYEQPPLAAGWWPSQSVDAASGADSAPNTTFLGVPSTGGDGATTNGAAPQGSSMGGMLSPQSAPGPAPAPQVPSADSATPPPSGSGPAPQGPPADSSVPTGSGPVPQGPPADSSIPSGSGPAPQGPPADSSVPTGSGPVPQGPPADSSSSDPLGSGSLLQARSIDN